MTYIYEQVITKAKIRTVYCDVNINFPIMECSDLIFMAWAISMYLNLSCSIWLQKFKGKRRDEIELYGDNWNISDPGIIRIMEGKVRFLS
jgi:hypothetical protein